MRLALRTQISFALIAIVAGLVLASVMISAMMRSVGEELEQIEGSARAIGSLHQLSLLFDAARSSIDAYVLSGDDNDYMTFLDRDRSIRNGIESLNHVESAVQEDHDDVEDIADLDLAYTAWRAEIVDTLVALRRQLPPGLDNLAREFETKLSEILAPALAGEVASPGLLVKSSQAIDRAYSRIVQLGPGPDRLAAWEALAQQINSVLAAAGEDGWPEDIEARTLTWVESARALARAVRDDEQRLRTRLSEAKQHPALVEFIQVLEERASEESEEQIERLEQSREGLWWFYLSLLMPTLPALIALVITGYAVFRLQRVVDPINRAATALAAGDYSARVDARGYPEFDVLQSALNGMAGRLHHSQRAARVLDELRTLLHSARRLDEAFAVIARFGPQLLPDTAGGVYLINASRTLVESALTWNQERMRGQMVFGLEDCWSLRSGQFHFHAGGEEGVACAHLREHSADATLCVPLVADEEVLGLLHVCCLDEGTEGVVMEDRRSLIATLAELIARTLAALRTSERLRDQSIRDPLSGLFNRRYLDATFERELNRTRRNGDPISCLIIDIDHFKTFNDRFGHAAGDAVIAEFGRLLLTNVRDADIVCRYGGEEFVVLMPQASRDNANRRAERLLTQIRQMHTRAGNAKYGVVTASIGVSSYPEHGDQPRALLQAADAALYRAKRSGRDRVEVALPRSAEAEFAQATEADATTAAAAAENYELPLADSE